MDNEKHEAHFLAPAEKRKTLDNIRAAIVKDYVTLTDAMGHAAEGINVTKLDLDKDSLTVAFKHIQICPTALRIAVTKCEDVLHGLQDLAKLLDVDLSYSPLDISTLKPDGV